MRTPTLAFELTSQQATRAGRNVRRVYRFARRYRGYSLLLIGNESVPKLILNSTINLFLKTAISLLVISNHNSFRVLFDKIASIYFIWKMYLYFSTENGQPREPALCQLYRHTFVPYADKDEDRNHTCQLNPEKERVKYNVAYIQQEMSNNIVFASARPDNYTIHWLNAQSLINYVQKHSCVIYVPLEYGRNLKCHFM